MADVKTAYDSSSNLTVTNLHGIASSATWVAGWTSGTIDNTSDLFKDFHVTANFLTESSGVSAGEIRVYIYTMLDDTNWPDLFSAGTEGTEGTATLHDTAIRDSLIPFWSTVNDNTASQNWPMLAQSVAQRFGGYPPAKFAFFVTQSTGTTLETSGNQFTVKGVYDTVG